MSDYTENTFSTVDMNTFITQAETRIYSTIQFPTLTKSASLALAAGVPYLDCPADFKSVDSLAIVSLVTGNYSFLLDKDNSFMREAYPNAATLGAPKYYALYGPQALDESKLRFFFVPTPDVAYPVALQYSSYPESITTVVSGQTWLGDNFSPVLLYGTLVEAYTQMKGEADMLALYDSKYKEAIALAKRLGDGAMKTDAYRSGSGRIKV